MILSFSLKIFIRQAIYLLFVLS